nr:hypothetical protein [Leptospira kirschneri]
MDLQNDLEDKQETKSHFERITIRTKPNDEQISVLSSYVLAVNIGIRLVYHTQSVL